MGRLAAVRGDEQEFAGRRGRADRLPVPDTADAAETVAWWLLTAPDAHPLWSQYLLACVRLRDNVPGFPPPRRQFDGATHELVVAAVDPTRGPYDPAHAAGGVPLLEPVNVAEQFAAADQEMAALTAWAAWGVTAGALWPETGDAPDEIRLTWRAVLAETLAHIRGEHTP